MRSSSKSKRSMSTQNILFDRMDAVSFGLILAFKKNIKYDYPIPPHYEIIGRAKIELDKLNITKNLRSLVEEVIFVSTRYDCPYLERVMDRDNVFGSEWFFGYANLYRWRKGKEDRAKALINKVLTGPQKRDLKKIQEAICFKWTTPPEPFRLNES